MVAELREALDRLVGDNRSRARAVHQVVAGPIVHPVEVTPGPDPSRDGRLRYRLRHPFADGTTHVELSAPELSVRLQVLAGRLRPDVTAHGVLALQPATRRLPEPLNTPSKRSEVPVGRCPRCDTPLQLAEVHRGEPEAA